MVLIDPESSEVNDKKLNSRLVIYTVEQKDGVRLTDDGVIKICGPGEYEIGGVEVIGINGGEGSRIYLIMADGLTLGVVGPTKVVLSEKKVEKMNSVDVLVINVGEGNGLTTKQIIDLSKELGANYLVPVGIENNSEIIKKLADEMDEEGREVVEQLGLEKESLPEHMELVILK